MRQTQSSGSLSRLPATPDSLRRKFVPLPAKLWKFVLDKVCMQHDLQLVKSRITGILDLQAPLFCMAKQMAQATHAKNVEEAVYALLELKRVWKKALFLIV